MHHDHDTIPYRWKLAALAAIVLIAAALSAAAWFFFSTAFLLFAAWLGLMDYADSLPEPGSDSAVGCVDDCLDPIGPEYHPEPLPIKEA